MTAITITKSIKNMSKLTFAIAVFCVSLSVWGFKGVQSYQAYQVAKSNLASRVDVASVLGSYQISYDWWKDADQVLTFSAVDTFNFHLSGELMNALSIVKVSDIDNEIVNCIKVIDGKNLNVNIVDDCPNTANTNVAVLN